MITMTDEELNHYACNGIALAIEKARAYELRLKDRLVELDSVTSRALIADLFAAPASTPTP